MIILDKKYTIKELYDINSFSNGFVKGVVDLELHGFSRGGMGIVDSDIKAKATEVICKWIQF